MTQINITLEEEILKDLFMGNREKSMTILLEQVINAVLSKQASEQLNAEPYERSEDRLTYRNGYREREITTRVGTLTLRVPKFRDGTFSTELFNSYQRSEKALILSMMEMVVQGVSTRKVGEIRQSTRKKADAGSYSSPTRTVILIFRFISSKKVEVILNSQLKCLFTA